MPRKARLKYENTGGWYHIYNSPSTVKRNYPLEKPYVYSQLISEFKRYVQVYCCQVASFEIMGNHFHAVAHFDPVHKLTEAQLLKRAKLIYSDKQLKAWSTKKWDRFAARIFDVSEMMRNVGANFARWYNDKYERKGVFWADRFKSTMLTDDQAALDCIAYVELNAVRAGLVKRPEEWKAGSLYLRESGQDSWLMPLEKFYAQGGARNYQCFKELIYYRGAVATQEGQHVISAEVLEAERKRGFERRGMYLEKIRSFTDGLIVGAKAAIKEHLQRSRELGHYLRRVNPIPVKVGVLFALREQRGHYKQMS